MQTPNLHLIRVVSLGATHTKPSRVKLVSERFKGHKSVTLSKTEYDTIHIEEIAIQWLTEQKFDIVGKAEGNGCMYIITDTFEPLVKEKKMEDVSVAFVEEGNWGITKLDEFAPFHSEATFKMVERYCERNKYNIVTVIGEDGEAW